MIKLALFLVVSGLTSAVSAQSRVGSATDDSPLQLDLFTPGVDLRSTDDLSVIQRIKDSDGTMWFIRQQGALFALYPRGINPNPAGTDPIPPGTRWFIGIQNLQHALGLSPLVGQAASTESQTFSSPRSQSGSGWALGLNSESPNADRWLIDESYRRRAVKRWVQFAALR
ncbi:MAG: hypothetical protein CMJ30_06720 [Phycisphaerae bacterium]|jgi:hypothetical protein|nr:hypothetical protein [Phycisphaerae bacterium]